MISAKVIADSISSVGKRITTLLLEYPRFIHSEFMTHRSFSRNAASSRAIPIERMIERVSTNMAYPIHWGKNQKGMQAEEELVLQDAEIAGSIWYDAAQAAIFHVKRLVKLGVHKQVANRLLEPFSHIATLVTATEWGNFFALRLHKDAQPEIQRLAEHMSDAMTGSNPTQLDWGEWHLPFVDELIQMGELFQLETSKKVSVARCARLSYYNVDGSSSSIENDITLYNKLVGSVPRHSSPAEHQATPLRLEGRSGNFYGWMQLRSLIEKNCV